MQKNPEIKKETDSPVTKAVKSLKIRNKHFIRIPVTIKVNKFTYYM